MLKTWLDSQNVRGDRPQRGHHFWRQIRSVLVFVFLASCSLFQPFLGAQVKPFRRILILNEVGTSYPLTNMVDQGIRSALENSPYRIEFYREYMETVEFPDPSIQRQFRDAFLHKYENRKPDVIITVGQSPLRLMIEAHQKFFSKVPVVFCLPNGSTTIPTLDSDFTGVEGDVSPAATLAAALRLLPETQHVVVVGGTTDWDKQQQTVVKSQLNIYKDRFDISYLTGLAMPDLQERLRHLPNHTVVLLAAIGQDATGTRFTSAESGPMVVAAANAPIFSLSDRFLNHGEVGGDVASANEQGKVAAGMALRVLNGEKPRDVIRLRKSGIYMFDWRALKRWGMRAKDLPPGSIVLNQPGNFWEEHKQYVLAGIFVFVAQTAAIVGLLWQRARRRKTEAQFRRSEEKFSKSFRRSPLAITITRASDCRYVEVNETFEKQSGWRRDEVIGRTPFDISLWENPDQRNAFLKQLLARGNVRDLEVKFRTKDGEIRTGLGSAELIEVNGESCALSVIADITERKQAEEVLSGISRKLIEAQETERARIARELHDDINQRLAMVAVNLKTLQQGLGASEAQTVARIEDLCTNISDLEDDIQALSHRLHSSRLEYLGLEAACSGFCRELAQQHNVKIDFRAEGIPEALPNEISLCLFRVMQESLHNAVKYSGVSEFEVSLTVAANEIQLSVRDSGVGFDTEVVSRGSGLGLISMKERLRLVDGQLSIKSHPQRGTTVIARVHFPTTAVGAVA